MCMLFITLLLDRMFTSDAKRDLNRYTKKAIQVAVENFAINETINIDV